MWFDEFADTILSGSARGLAFNRFIGPKLLGLPANAEAGDKAEADAKPALDYLEGQMLTDGWLVGPYSLADISVASCLKTMSYGLDLKPWPGITAWFERVAERPAWQEVAAQEMAVVDAAVASGAHRPS